MKKLFNLILNQNGDDVPQISFGNEQSLFSVTKDSAGTFYLNSDGLFVGGKTFMHIQSTFGDDYPYTTAVDVVNGSPNQILFKTMYNGIPTDGLLKNTPILLIIEFGQSYTTEQKSAVCHAKSILYRASLDSIADYFGANLIKS